jgi:hypothetical protein
VIDIPDNSISVGVSGTAPGSGFPTIDTFTGIIVELGDIAVILIKE